MVSAESQNRAGECQTTAMVGSERKNRDVFSLTLTQSRAGIVAEIVRTLAEKHWSVTPIIHSGETIDSHMPHHPRQIETALSASSCRKERRS
jgi:hypothetical protein